MTKSDICGPQTEEQQRERNEYVCDTTLTIESVRKALLKSEKIKDDASEQFTVESWTGTKIGIGQGYVSHIIRLDIEWSKPSLKLPKSVVLKIPTLQKMDSLLTPDDYRASGKEPEKCTDFMLSVAHKKECTVYDEFNRTGGPKAIPMVKVYHTQTVGLDHPGVIVMEDLSGRGKIANLVEGLNLKQVLQIAEAIASLHAYSLENNEWQTKFQEIGIWHKEYQPFIELIANGIKQIEIVKPEYFKDKVSKVAENVDLQLLLSALPICAELDLPPVIVHGDLWTNNMLFEIDENCVLNIGDRLLAIIDWQGARAGLISEDFCRLLVMSCSGDLRRREGRAILRHYYNCLCSMLGKEKVPFSFDAVLRAYDRLLPLAMSLYVSALVPIANMPFVQEPDKELNMEKLYKRGLDIVEDVIVMLENKR